MMDVIAIGWSTEDKVITCENIVVGRRNIEIQHALEFFTIGND